MISTIFLQLLVSSACKTSSVQCVCYPAVPFEGFQVYVSEKCDATESGYAYGNQFFDTPEQCQAWIDQDKNCQSLL